MQEITYDLDLTAGELPETLAIELESCEGSLDPRAGSFDNSKEAERVLTWLIENQPLLEKKYKTHHVQDIFAIVTTFESQRDLIKTHIKMHYHVNVPVYHVGQKFLKRYPVILLSSCYTPDYQGGFLLDHEDYFLHLLSRCKNQLVWFSHPDAFKAYSHAISSKLYQYALGQRNSICQEEIENNADDSVVVE